MDRVPPSEGGGCPFEPGREQIDVRYMRQALALADTAAEAGEIPVGAVLVLDDGRVIEAANEKERRPDPTAHAEMLAISAAAHAAGVWRIGGTLYVTKEPCPMCAGAIVAARITRLVFGCVDPKGGAAGGVIDVFGSAAVNHRVEVHGGVLAAETGDQLRAYFRRKRGLRSSARRRTPTERRSVALTRRDAAGAPKAEHLPLTEADAKQLCPGLPPRDVTESMKASF